MGLTERVAILAGITPMKNTGMARYMQKRVPGMDVPEEVVKRIAGVPKEKQADEGIAFAIEQIEEIKASRASRASTSWPSSGRRRCRKSSSGRAYTPGPR